MFIISFNNAGMLVKDLIHIIFATQTYYIQIRACDILNDFKIRYILFNFILKIIIFSIWVMRIHCESANIFIDIRRYFKT